MSLKTELITALRGLTNACTELAREIPDDFGEGSIVPPDYITPCPFCGDMNSVIDSCDGKFYVHCPECDADGPMCESISDAVKMWDVFAREG